MRSNKPRPVSMMIPRSGTFGPTDLPAKAAEAPEASRAAPDLEPAVSSFEVTNRPKLNRLKTPDFSLPPDDKTRGLFTKGAYADAHRVRAKIFNLGQPLHTEAHDRLISNLRDECARLHGYTQFLKGRLSSAHDKTQAIENDVQDLRAEISALKAQNTHLVTEHAGLSHDLRKATEALIEVDTMFLDVRMRRISRISEGNAPTPSPEPPERPKSPTPDSRSVL